MNGCFQFFFASKEEQLPYPDVPTRDVTNTWHKGNKTEPHFEKMMENWCPCRARFVTANVKKALQGGSNHCMILTTNHPQTKDDLAVGVLYFSGTEYEGFKARYAGRWTEKKYLPYVGSNDSKLVSLSDAFRFRPWMTTNEKYLPGKRCGIVYADAYPDLLERILDHFANAPDQIERFLINVRYLETILERDDRDGWKHYWNDKQGLSYNSSACTVRAIRRARC
jgi:hypothetical protein